MKRVAAAFLCLLAACGPAQPTATGSGGSFAMTHREPVVLTADDGVKVFATCYVPYPQAPTKATILLFHQAGASKGEYATIARQLAEAGYEALAVDQRAGGNLYGVNETVRALGRSAGYLDAQADLQAAIDWARARKLPIVLWGSSYSSSLVILAAARNPDVKAVLAFSPGEYFDDKTLVRTAAAKLAVPVYVTVAGGVEERAAAQPIVSAVPRGLATFYVPAAGVHGSSTLDAERNPRGALSNRQPVRAFLRRVAP